ncbi:MAG: SRPBCC domain-containing protein [Bdellovibrionales bacterium]|nr:SRPBCC domain-containing protein [Bdellovibrionales bacterium]
MPNIIHRVGIKSELNHVFQAISSIEGLSHWWTKNTKGVSEENGEIVFTFKEDSGVVLGEMKMKVVQRLPNERMEWICLAGPEDWVGTSFTFDLKKENEFTILNFGHRNWAQETESMAHCNMKWGTFLLSLKNYVETGKGRPSPEDIKIDNWN